MKKATEQALRRIQIEMQYALNTYCNETETTPEQLADRTEVSLKSIRQMLSGSFTGSYASFVRVALSINQAPLLSLSPLPTSSEKEHQAGFNACLLSTV